MPWWAKIYLGTYAVLLIGGIILHLKKLFSGTKSCFVWLSECFGSFASPIIWIYFFAAFWVPSLSNTLGFAPPFSIVVAVIWDIYTWSSDTEDNNQHGKLSDAQQKTVKYLVIIWQLPVYLFATIAAFRDYIHF